MESSLWMFPLDCVECNSGHVLFSFRLFSGGPAYQVFLVVPPVHVHGPGAEHGESSACELSCMR